MDSGRKKKRRRRMVHEIGEGILMAAIRGEEWDLNMIKTHYAYMTFSINKIINRRKNSSLQVLMLAR